MAFHDFIACAVRRGTVLLVVSALGLNGCAAVGPRSITAGRSAYTEVINRTEDEQLLNVLVRMRYDETSGMLSVASVTANLRFSTQAAVQVGAGDEVNYVGNLVPLSAGVGYEENPTISYVPLHGYDYMLRLISPVSTSEWVLMTGAVKRHALALDLGVRRINGMKNPLVGEAPQSPQFARLAALFEQLRRDTVLDIVRTDGSDEDVDYFWYLHDYQDAHDARVREFLTLLGIEATTDGSDIILPLREAVGRPASAIHIQMRSPHDVLRAFEAGIEVPLAHLEAGIVEPLDTPVPAARRFFAVRSSKKRPDSATVQIFFRDWWFYIDATDTISKRAFSFLRTFIGMRLVDSDASAVQRAPVLTVPVN